MASVESVAMEKLAVGDELQEVVNFAADSAKASPESCAMAALRKTCKDEPVV